jgi:hypothetical protein
LKPLLWYLGAIVQLETSTNKKANRKTPRIIQESILFLKVTYGFMQLITNILRKCAIG